MAPEPKGVCLWFNNLLIYAVNIMKQQIERNQKRNTTKRVQQISTKSINKRWRNVPRQRYQHMQTYVYTI